jgi:lysophospholipase L1-like esterase
MKPKYTLVFLQVLLALTGCRMDVLPGRVPTSTPMIPKSPLLKTSTPTATFLTHTPAPKAKTIFPSATEALSRNTATFTLSHEPTLSPAASRPWRIMPLGDSLTSGNYPGRVHSYRGYLEVLLREAGYSFDFVGTQSRLAHDGTDPDHEGHSGFTIGPDEARFCEACSTANLYDHLKDYLQTEPDIILLLIGINDLLPLDVRPVKPEEAPGKLAALVERIQELHPGAYLFLASLAPVNYRDETQWPAYQAVNQKAEAVAARDPHDQIYFVDANRILERTLDPEMDFADGIHLAEGGARKLAQVWFDALADRGVLAQAPIGP